MFLRVYPKTTPRQTLHALQVALRQPPANDGMQRLLPVRQQALREGGGRPRSAPPAASGAGRGRGKAGPTWRLRALNAAGSGRPRPPSNRRLTAARKRPRPTRTACGCTKPRAKGSIGGRPWRGQTARQESRRCSPDGLPAHGHARQRQRLSRLCAHRGTDHATKKKPTGQELSVGEKLLNSLFSSARVVVEHGIAGVKGCRIVKEVWRLTKEGLSDLVRESACGLHNLRVSCRHPLPAFDLLSLVSGT